MRTGIIMLQDDLAEVFRGRKPPVDFISELMLLITIGWQLTYGAGWSLYILFLDSIADVRDGQTACCHLVRIHPDAHGIVRTEDADVTNAFDAFDLV